MIKSGPVAILTMLLSTNLLAQDIELVGTITKEVKIPSSNSQTIKNQREANIESLKFLKVKLSSHALDHLSQKAKEALDVNKNSARMQLNGSLPGKINLGMNNVPVLNQGMHGTCVTFAATAAVDASLGLGDYVSQLCQLELGSYLEKNSYSLSGWDGSWGRIALNQMDVFGLINKQYQMEQGCAGIREYPTYDAPVTAQLSPEEYKSASENMMDRVYWTPILDVFQATSDRVDTNKTLNDVKTALKSGDRLTFGVLLLDFDLGFMGAVGTHQTTFDTWVLTPEIARDVYLHPEFGGHEMVITGYDDDAVAVDEQGQAHRGLLTLRNSWGDKVGNQGDFYMSYDYFKLLAVEVLRVRSVRQ